MNINTNPEIQEFLAKYDCEASRRHRLLLDEQGIINLFPAEFYHRLDNDSLRVWCICRAIYQLPTIELKLFELPTCKARRRAPARNGSRITLISTKLLKLVRGITICIITSELKA